MADQAILKLPLIGNIGVIDCLDFLENKVVFPRRGQEEPEGLEDVERVLGDFLLGEKKYKKILDLLFPAKMDLAVGKVKSIVIDRQVDQVPLIAKTFLSGSCKSVNPLPGKLQPGELRSAWSNLMLDLGEFKLGKQFDQLQGCIASELNYAYSTSDQPNSFFVFNARFDDSQEINEEIWDRILGTEKETKAFADTFVVFIDDSEDFSEKWGLGIKNLIKIDKSTIQPNNFRLWQKTWLKPEGSYPEQRLKQVINRIFEFFEMKAVASKKLIFVVDLLYQSEDNNSSIESIEGDTLIRYLRNEFNANPLIIGFTGGESPFIINSAVKAGADIVIMKQRGKSYAIGSSHSTGNPGGLFDLLWALSKNISRWRFLESYKCLAELKDWGDRFNLQLVLDKLFFSIENESPFWRNFLQDWQRNLEDLRLKSILFSQQV